MRYLAAIAVLLTVVAVAACGNQPPQLPRLASDAVILAFGDSLTYGTGVGVDASYPAVLEKLTGRTVINAGVPGEITADGVKRLPALLDEEHPDLLILCHGGNDLLRKLDRDQTIANLRTMILAARSRNIPVVLIAVPQPTLLLRESAEFYEQLAQEMQLPLEDDALARIESDDALKSDPIHPNANGYRELAGAINTLLQRSGAI